MNETHVQRNSGGDSISLTLIRRRLTFTTDEWR